MVPDLPGAGASDALAAPHSAPRLARALGAYLRATGTWGERVVGNSMGGDLAMRLALDEPAAMSRLVNVHSPVLPLPRLHALHFALGTGLAGGALGPQLVARATVRASTVRERSWDIEISYPAPIPTFPGP